MFILRENKQSKSRTTAALPNARGSTSEAATPISALTERRTDGLHQRGEKKLKANKQSNQEYNGAVKGELRIPMENRAIDYMFPR